MAGIRRKALFTKSVVERDTDLQTGEILSEIRKDEIVITKTVSTEQFIQIYVEDLSGMFNLETKTEIRLMSIIWRDCEFNDKNSNLGNRVYALKATKEKWAEEVGVSLSSINNTITAFIKKELLIQDSRSVYIVNPKYFFKGFSKDQPEVLRTILEYRIHE